MEFNDKNLHYRHLMLFAYNRGCKAAQAAREICEVYGKGVVSVRTVQKWFEKFRSGKFSLIDEIRSGRPTDFDEDHLNALLKDNGRQSTHELAVQMKCNQMTICRHLKSMGKVQKMGV